jgi:hypothetical protein
MREADTLAGLATELRGLSGRDRRAVFKALSPFERAQAEALLEASGPAPRAEPDLSGFSPWLAKHVLAAHGNEDGRNLTPATRGLLAEVAGAAARGRASSRAAATPRPRSLADALVHFLMPGAAR